MDSLSPSDKGKTRVSYFNFEFNSKMATSLVYTLNRPYTKTAISDRNSSRSASTGVGGLYSRDSPCSAFLPEAKIPDANPSDVAVPHTSHCNQEIPVELCALMRSLKHPISG